MPDTDTQPLTPRRILLVIATGVGAGFLSGLFGVGGGLVIVPALMAVLRMDQRRASATSLAAIIVTVFVIVSQYLHVPTRDGVVTLTPASCAWTVLVGLCAGILSGLVGVGGGSVIVPGMELAVGAGDLIARGTSLLVMIPTGIAGTVTNLRHRMVDLRVGLIVGASAAALAPLGRLMATWVSPTVGAILFNIFLLSIIASTIARMRRKARAQG